MRVSGRPLLHPWIDFLMLGGLSILFIMLVTATGLQAMVTQEQALLVFFALSFFVNLPHFAATYLLFYKDHYQKILKLWSWRMVGVVLPAILLIYLILSYVLSSWKDISHLVTLMFYLVGWHYVKQVFGCVVVVLHRADYVLSIWQKKLLKTNLICLWLTTLSAYSDYRPKLAYNSLGYSFYYLPQFTLYILFAAMLLTAGGFFYLTYHRSQKQGVLFPVMAWVPLAAVYLWFIPVFHQQIIFMALPLFHALQYLLFVTVYKINQESPPNKSLSFKNAFMFLFYSFLLGAFFMEIFPRSLDLMITLKMSSITIFLVMFNVFINIHHYLMDYVLWRSDVPEFKNYVLNSN